jgi:hypothetical protein
MPTSTYQDGGPHLWCPPTFGNKDAASFFVRFTHNFKDCCYQLMPQNTPNDRNKFTWKCGSEPNNCSFVFEITKGARKKPFPAGGHKFSATLLNHSPSCPHFLHTRSVTWLELKEAEPSSFIGSPNSETNMKLSHSILEAHGEQRLPLIVGLVGAIN